MCLICIVVSPTVSSRASYTEWTHKWFFEWMNLFLCWKSLPEWRKFQAYLNKKASSPSYSLFTWVRCQPRVLPQTPESWVQGVGNRHLQPITPASLEQTVLWWSFPGQYLDWCVNCRFLYLMEDSFIQEISIECLLCVKHSSRHWGWTEV